MSTDITAPTALPSKDPTDAATQTLLDAAMPGWRDQFLNADGSRRMYLTVGGFEEQTPFVLLPADAGQYPPRVLLVPNTADWGKYNDQRAAFGGPAAPESHPQQPTAEAHAEQPAAAPASAPASAEPTKAAEPEPAAAAPVIEASPAKVAPSGPVAAGSDVTHESLEQHIEEWFAKHFHTMAGTIDTVWYNHVRAAADELKARLHALFR